MRIKREEIERLSNDIRRIVDGEDIDLRISEEGVWNILRNDIHILAQRRREQVTALQHDRNLLKDILADISHQIKTPLTSMMILIDLLEEATPEKRGEFVQNIKAGLSHTDWLASTLLKMAKLEANAVNFTLNAVSSDEIVQAALLPLQIQLELREQQVKPLNQAELYCDKRWTAEALGNIIKNASEHSPIGSIISIESGSNPICDWISIADSGEGLSNVQISQLFQRFGSTGTNGYGIGLSLAHAIMRGQNGTIEVSRNKGGEGMTFALKFFR